MSRTRRPSLRLFVLVLSVAGLAACGGSGSAKTTATRPSKRDTSTTSEAGGGTATDDSTAAVGPQAALGANDVGSEFSPYRKADGVLAVGSQSCSATPAGAVLTTRDHVYSGPMYKKKDASYFAYSEVYVFRTEELAMQYAAFRATPAFKQCKVRQDDAATRDARAGTFVKLTPVDYPNPSGHIPTMYRELTGSVTDGKKVANAFYDRYTVRHGPVVVVVSIDAAFARDDAGSQAVAEQTGDILRSLDTRLAKA